MAGQGNPKRRRNRAWFFGVIALCIFGAGHAAPGDPSVDYDTKDARLNAAYKALLASLDDTGRKALRDEERQWILGRNTMCKVPADTVVKNPCTTTQTSFRADELEKRMKGRVAKPAGTMVAASTLAGEWAYRSDCDRGHSAEFAVQKTSPTVEGTWSDGTNISGSQGRFKGDWRDGKLYVRFCSEDGGIGDYPACPAYADVGAYVVPEGTKLAWYRTVGAPSENTFDKYLVLGRKPNNGDVPKDSTCKDAD